MSRNGCLQLLRPALGWTMATALALSAFLLPVGRALAATADPRDVALVRQMTLDEKVNQLMLLSRGTMTGPDSAGRPNGMTAEQLARAGIGSQMSDWKWSAADLNRVQRVAVEESRLHIPVIFATDIIHGYWTIFPVPLGLAATWDPEDARTMARVSGIEGYSNGQRWTFAPMVDHPFDPRWGRVVETFGESPLVSSDYAVATVEGFQHALAGVPESTAPADFAVASCLKHYLGYGAVQGGKDYAYVDLSERTMREYHLPPYAAAIKAGAATVMPAFTTGPGGVPMSANRYMLQDVLRGELGFDGVIVSDYAAMTELRNHGTAADDFDAAVKSLVDGTMTVDMEDGVYYAQLAKAVQSGKVSVAAVDREVLRVLTLKRRLGLWEHPYVPEDMEKRVRLSASNRAAAREVARRAVVLLKNDAGLLPISSGKRILVTGPLADAGEDTMGPWSGRGVPADTVTILQGIRERAGAGGSGARATITYSEGPRLDRDGNALAEDDERIAAAVKAAADQDLIIAVVGERASLSGEARNRSRLDLPGKQQPFVDALLATGKPVVVVLLSGRALAIPALVTQTHALIHSFFPGTEGGHALADVLFGDYNPGGKEPVTWPRSVGQLPIHHYDPPNGRPNLAERGDYGARWLDESDQPLFPFGYGLSYTRFKLDALEVPATLGRQDELRIRVRVTNVGERAGDETPQLYVRPRVASSVTGRKLQAYKRVHLAAGQSTVVEFRLPASQLAIFGPDAKRVLEPGTYEVQVGSDAGSGLTGTFSIAD